MSAAVYGSIADLLAGRGVEVGPTDWFPIDQARVDQFADATEDQQWIHVDPERAKRGPFGGTIAHGFLTLSLVPYFVGQLRNLDNVRMTVNYGLNKVRFPSPVQVGGRVRGRSVITDVEHLDGNAAQLTTRITIELDGSVKPACVAETVSRIYFTT